MFTGQKTFVRHRKMCGLRGRGDHDGVDGVVFEQNTVVCRRRGWPGSASNFSQALWLDLGQVKGAHQRAGGAGFGAQASTPTCPNDSDADLPHGPPAWFFIIPSRDAADGSTATSRPIGRRNCQASSEVPLLLCQSLARTHPTEEKCF